jgi:hypothetical protein
VDVPPKLSARTRVFATGQGRKTDATDAHSVALAATRMIGLRQVVNDQQLAVLRILANHRRSLGEDHTRMISQLHQLLLELIPGGAKKDLSAAQAKALLARVRPRDTAGKARRRVAAELISDLERIYQRKKEANKELNLLLAATGTTLTEQTWKTAEILILRHQLALLQRQQPRRPNLNWADRALLAVLLGVIPKARRRGPRLLVTPGTGTARSSGAAGQRGPCAARPAGRRPAGTSRPWFSGWPGRTLDGATAGFTASWPAWE